MVDPFTGDVEPEITVNGSLVNAMSPSMKDDLLQAVVNLVIGDDAPKALFQIGNTVSLGYGDRKPTLFRVVELSVHSDWDHLFNVRLEEVVSGDGPAYDPGLVYGAVFETIVNRVRIQGLIEALIDKGIMSQTEWDNRFRRVAEERLTSYASTIVSDEDAESIKDAVLHSGGTVSSGSEGAEAAR